MTKEFYLLINLRKAAAHFAITQSNADKIEMIRWIDKVDRFMAGEDQDEIITFDSGFKSLLEQYREGSLSQPINYDNNTCNT
jgi:hypothetical protein